MGVQALWEQKPRLDAFKRLIRRDASEEKRGESKQCGQRGSQNPVQIWALERERERMARVGQQTLTL